MRTLHGRLIVCCFSLLLPLAFAPPAPANDGHELIRIASLGDAAGVRRLLDAGVDADARSHAGGTALIAAAEGRHLEVVRMLIEAGAKPNQRAPDNWTALFTAANKGDLEIAKLLLEAGADPDVAPATYGGGRSPLMAALGNGNMAMAWLLLDAGANVNATTSYGATPLWFAVWGDTPERRRMVRALIDAGADVDAGQQAPYKLPPSASNIGPDGSVIIGVGRRSAEGTVLGNVSASGQLEYARLLIEAGADVDARQPGWRTPLMLAAANGRTEVVRLLLQQGADRDAKDSDGRDALTYARLARHEEIVRLLDAR